MLDQGSDRGDTARYLARALGRKRKTGGVPEPQVEESGTTQRVQPLIEIEKKRRSDLVAQMTGQIGLETGPPPRFGSLRLHVVQAQAGFGQCRQYRDQNEPADLRAKPSDDVLDATERARARFTLLVRRQSGKGMRQCRVEVLT